MPCAPNSTGSSRLTLSPVSGPTCWAAWKTGPEHQVIMRLSRPAAAMAASPIRPSLTASQRVRVTLWLHASRNVPASISRAISGAPQNAPMRAGAPYSTTTPTRSSTSSIEPRNALMKLAVTRGQSPRAWQAAIPLVSYRCARCRPVTATSTASAADVTMVWTRNWRQVNHIIAIPPEGDGRDGRSGQAAPADPPEAEAGQDDGQDEEDRGLVPLEGPVAAGRLIGQQLPKVQPAERGLARLEGGRLALAGRGGRAGKHVAGLGNGLVGQDPGARFVHAPDHGHAVVVADHQAVDVGGIEGHGGADGRDQVGPDPAGHGDLDQGEDGEGHGHGGQGAADEYPGGNAEGEGEGGVADRGDAARGEQQRVEPVEGGRPAPAGDPDGPVDRTGPPGDHEAEQSGGGHGGQSDQAQLDRQPAGAGDALAPGQPEGAGLDLAGDQRRAPEHADDGRRQEHEADADVKQQRVGSAGFELTDEVAGEPSAVAVGEASGDPAGGIQAGQVRAGGGEGDGRDGQGGGRRDGLGAELAPGQPHHRWASSAGLRPGAAAAWLM